MEAVRTRGCMYTLSTWTPGLANQLQDNLGKPGKTYEIISKHLLTIRGTNNNGHPTLDHQRMEQKGWDSTSRDMKICIVECLKNTSIYTGEHLK